MSQDIVRLLVFVGISIIQWGFGYIHNKWLGMIIPIGFYGYLAMSILPKLSTLSIGKLIVLILLLLLLGGIFYGSWKSGFDAKNKSIKKDLEKMEAQDLKNRK